MRLLGRLLAKLPYRLLHALGAALGTLAYALGIRRRVVLSNLRLAFPEKADDELRAIARETYRNLGRGVLDFLRIPALPREELERLLVRDGWDRFEQAMARGKGVIAATAHFGNFEVLASAHTLQGIPITTVSRRMADSRVNDAWRGARTSTGVEEIIVKRGETLRGARRVLEQGKVLGYMIDQNQPARHAIFPTFFGVPAATAATPALLSRRTGAPVVFALSWPLGDGRHRVIIEGPLEPPDTGDRVADVLAFTQDLNDRLERHVRAHPEHWYWLHRRWKTRPPEPARGAPAAAPGTLTPPDGAG